MTDRKPKKGDLVSYRTSQLDVLGPRQGALGVVIEGPNRDGKVEVRWLKKFSLEKLFKWNSTENLRIESPSPRLQIERAPRSYESPVFLEPEEGDEFENDELF
tara:strand:- start:56 stop:364 length:309 start_codon:yes stop_codon:yes gene_type:complete